VRRKLIQKYGAVAQRKDGMIPAHLLGNMWAQEWGNIYDLVRRPQPRPLTTSDKILQQQNHRKTVRAVWGKFLPLARLEALPDTFWQRSLFTRPADPTSSATPAPGIIDSDRDVRLKVCVHGTTDDFITVHHELGHTYYYLAYRKQPGYSRRRE